MNFFQNKKNNNYIVVVILLFFCMSVMTIDYMTYSNDVISVMEDCEGCSRKKSKRT